MLNFEEIKKFFPKNLHHFERFLLREYLQHKILEIIFESPFGEKLSFIGGTCLRIVHGNQRFSEDLDFDNFDLTTDDFEETMKLVEKHLEREGYKVEMRNVFKGAFHCYIRFPDLLFQSGLTGHKEEKILIRLDTEAQGFDFKPQNEVISKFDVFTTMVTTPIDILLAQKFYAICNRKRAKGRDFFDVTFLLPQTEPNYDYLKLKMDITNSEQLKEKVLQACNNIDFDEMANDVKPFLFNSKDLNRVTLFTRYFDGVKL